MCVNNVSKESEQRAAAQVATEQRENQEAIKNRHVLIGMTTAQVRQSWGEPKWTSRTITDRAEYQYWHYGSELKGTTLLFVDGVLKSGTRDGEK